MMKQKVLDQYFHLTQYTMKQKVLGQLLYLTHYIPTNKNTWNTRVKHVSIGESHVSKAPWITGESVTGGTHEIVGISVEQKHVKYSGKTRVDGENLVNKNTWNTRV